MAARTVVGMGVRVRMGGGDKVELELALEQGLPGGMHRGWEELALGLGRVELGWDGLRAGVRERKWGTAVGTMIGAG